MKSALGVELRSGRCVRVWEDGRTELVAAAAADVADAPDATALAVGEGLDATAWREWAATRFGRDALDVAEDVARTYAEDVAAGAALWALEQVKRRVAVVPTVPPIAGTPPQSSGGASMGDFGEGRSMSDFGEGQSMSDFAEPTRMSDFGDGRSMDEFGDGRSMDEFGGAKRVPKARILVAAAVTVAVIAATAVVVSASGRDNEPTVPVAVASTVTEPEPTTTTTTVPAERTFDVTFTVASTNADPFPDAPLKTGKTGVGEATLVCDGDVCRFDFTTDSVRKFSIDGLSRTGDSIEGVEQTAAPAEGLHGDCDRQYTETVTIADSGEGISGTMSFAADPVTCPGPEQNTIHVYVLNFEGTAVTGSPGSAESGTTTTFAPEAAPAPPEAGA